VNCALFTFHGMLAERMLGSGRVALLTFFCLAVQIVLAHFTVEGRVHGASGMTWSYGLFVFEWLRVNRARLRREPFAWVAAALLVFCVAGLVKHWHLWNLLLSVPFFVLWRKHVHAPPERDTGRLAGIAAALAVLAFNAMFVARAVLRIDQPMSVECAELENGRVPCVIDFSGRDGHADVSFEVRLECANGSSTTEIRTQAMGPHTQSTVHISGAHCDRVVNGGVRKVRVERR
jgi:hypothetical protein